MSSTGTSIQTTTSRGAVQFKVYDSQGLAQLGYHDLVIDDHQNTDISITLHTDDMHELVRLLADELGLTVLNDPQP